MYKKLILSLALGLFVFVGESLAETTGSCGTNCTYTMDDAGHAIVTGTGTLTGVKNLGNATSITIEGFSSIGDWAFSGNKNIKEVILSNGVKSIGGGAFWGASLESVVIPNSVTSIGDGAFRYSLLTSIDIPASVTNIGGYAFGEIPTLTNAEIQGKNVNIAANTFNRMSAQVHYAGNVAWSCGTDCVETLDTSGHAEFTGTGTLTTGTAAGFKNGITSVTISDGITSIEKEAFLDAKSLTSIDIPDSVISIGVSAFQRTKLTSVTIPDSVTSIDKYAFYEIPTLKEIFCSEASVESGKCAALASAGNANVSKINFGYYEDDAMSEERIFYLKDENGVWQEAKRESIYEKYVSDTGAVYLYDSKGNLKKMRGKKIYTVEEAEEATKNGNSFHVGLTYK